MPLLLYTFSVPPVNHHTLKGLTSQPDSRMLESDQNDPEDTHQKGGLDFPISTMFLTNRIEWLKLTGTKSFAHVQPVTYAV